MTRLRRNISPLTGLLVLLFQWRCNLRFLKNQLTDLLVLWLTYHRFMEFGCTYARLLFCCWFDTMMDLKNVPLSPKICTGAALLTFLYSCFVTGCGSFLILVIKLSCIKYGKVQNLWRFKDLCNYCIHSCIQGNTI